LMILNCKNPKVDINTSSYLVEVLGGTACLGAFTTFPENFKTSYQVFAQSEKEVRERILELGVYQCPQNTEIKIISLEPATKEHFYLNRGVARTFPFEKYQKDTVSDTLNLEDEFNGTAFLIIFCSDLDFKYL